MVITAYQLAARAHAGQMRKNGEPVLTHCIETALIVAQLGLPDDLVATALLADVLSDTPLSPWHLEEHVPRSVTEAVAKVRAAAVQQWAVCGSWRRAMHARQHYVSAPLPFPPQALLFPYCSTSHTRCTPSSPTPSPTHR